MFSRMRTYPLEFPDAWLAEVNQPVMSLWDDQMGRSCSTSARSSGTSSTARTWSRPAGYKEYLVEFPGKGPKNFYVDVLNGEMYKVDDETDNITEEDCWGIWPLVEQADAAEIGQFVETKSFKKIHRQSLEEDMVIVDAVWIRKWKRMPDGSRKVKSRLCARGCFDTQKDLLSTRSTTATRLSQRLLVSLSVNEDFDNESWDVSGAFLKGFDFRKVQELLRAKGIVSPDRRVVVIVPANVWRHLMAADEAFRVPEGQLGEYM